VTETDVLINTNLTLDFIIQIFHTSIKVTYPHAQFEVQVNSETCITNMIFNQNVK
jgi:hypothetical protein